jgi:hypothetical protein
MNKTDAEIAAALHERSDRERSSEGMNVVIVYENDQTRCWAEKVLNKAMSGNGKHPVRSTWWRLNNLDEPAVLAGAVSTAIRADLIIVSVTSGGGLPLPFYIWADAWVPNRRAAGGELVALIGTHNEREYRLNHLVRDYLRAAARTALLDFRLEERRLPASPARIEIGQKHVNGSATRTRRVDGPALPAPAILS